MTPVTNHYTTVGHHYSYTLDMIYGALYCVCFLLGLVGNILSFTHFLKRRRDLPNTLYKVISATDIMTSVASLAVGVSFLSSRQPGLIFGNEVLCYIWTYVWHITSRLSIFLVVVLSGSRTYYLMKPFHKQRVLPYLLIILAYCLLQVGQTIGFQVQQKTEVTFERPMARCVLLFPNLTTKHMILYSDIVRIFTFVVPMFIVIFSGLLSIKITLRRVDKNVMKLGSGRKELQRSRNRATVTILLFTGVYTIFNVPLVVSEILHTIDYHTDYSFDFHSFDYNGKYMLYFDNFVSMLSVSLNAAINPLLYLWRMPGCQRYIKRRSLLVVNPRSRSVSMRKDSAITETFAMSRLNHVRLSEDRPLNQALWSNNGSLQSCVA